MINFAYKNPNDEHEHRLDLRIDPYNVEWTYNLNTQVFDTYGGQVVQVLSVNIDRLTIDGQFGREGPFGIHQNKTVVRRGGHKVHVAVEDPRWGGPVEPGDWVTNHVSQQHNSNSTPDHIGLYQFAQFFIKYFTVHSQGGAKGDPGNYIQTPMHITYDAGPYPDKEAHAGAHGQTEFRHWMAFPTSLPNFSRSNEEFAPLWELEFSVYQSYRNVEVVLRNEAIKTLSRIRDGIGWEAQNPWVDPAANPKDPPETVLHKLVSEYKH